MNAAAAAGGAAARVAAQQFNNWLTGPPPAPAFNMGPMYNALPTPSNPKGRGRGGRRGRGRGRGPQAAARPRRQPTSVTNTSSGSVIVVRDTEVIGSPPAMTDKALSWVLEFNPSIDSIPRLAAHEKMYRRYRIKYINISFRSGSGTATAGNMAVGVMVGPKDTSIISTDHVLKLRPSFYVPAWKNDSLTLGRDIDLSRFMLCGDTSADGIAFTLYVGASAANLGMIQVSYEVEFSHPRPF